MTKKAPRVSDPTLRTATVLAIHHDGLTVIIFRKYHHLQCQDDETQPVETPRQPAQIAFVDGGSFYLVI